MTDEPNPNPAPMPSAWRPPAPRLWTPFFAFVFGIIALLLTQSVVLLATVVISDDVSVNPGPSETGMAEAFFMPPVLFVGIVLSELALAAVVVAGAWFSPVPARIRLRLVSSGLSIGRGVTIALGTLSVWALGTILATGLFEGASEEMQNLTAALQGASTGWKIVLILTLAVFPGVCEELMFRGYIQTRLLQRWPAPVAIGVTAILFASMHLSPQWIVAVLPLALWAGFLTWRTGSLWPAIGCHILNNAAASSLSFLPEEDVLLGTRVVYIGGAIGLPFLVLAIARLMRPGPGVESKPTRPNGGDPHSGSAPE